MVEVKRYTPEVIYALNGAGYTRMAVRADGQWVLFADHEAECSCCADDDDYEEAPDEQPITQP